MRCLIFISPFLLFISCKPKKNTDIKKPTWLIGKWQRTNNKPNHLSYETWYSNFSEFGVTLKEKDTTFFEKMKLLVKNDTLILEISSANEQLHLLELLNKQILHFWFKICRMNFRRKLNIE